MCFLPGEIKPGAAGKNFGKIHSFLSYCGYCTNSTHHTFLQHHPLCKASKRSYFSKSFSAVGKQFCLDCWDTDQHGTCLLPEQMVCEEIVRKACSKIKRAASGDGRKLTPNRQSAIGNRQCNFSIGNRQTQLNRTIRKRYLITGKAIDEYSTRTLNS